MSEATTVRKEEVPVPSPTTHTASQRPSFKSKDKQKKPAPPKPKTNTRPGENTQPKGEMIPVTGWFGEDKFNMHPIDTPRPTFTISADAYSDLIDVEYQLLQGHDYKEAKRFTLATFRYYCAHLWWNRVLQLKHDNGYALNEEERRYLQVHAGIEELWIPNHIAQYLSSIGNIELSTDRFYFKLLEYDQYLMDDGYFGEGTSGDVGANSFWLYADLPCPGLLAKSIGTEIWNTQNLNNMRSSYLPSVDATLLPTSSDKKWLPTRNIFGFEGQANTDRLRSVAPSSSATTAFRNLGWGAAAQGIVVYPTDIQLKFKISVSTLELISTMIQNLKSVAIYPRSRVFASRIGSPVQAGCLSVTLPSQSRDYASRFLALEELKLESREMIQAPLALPGFIFGFRPKRGKVFSSLSKSGEYEYHQRSSAQPWKLVDNTTEPTEYFDPAPAALLMMNAVYDFGDSRILNATRKMTSGYQRCVIMPGAAAASTSRS